MRASCFSKASTLVEADKSRRGTRTHLSGIFSASGVRTIHAQVSPRRWNILPCSFVLRVAHLPPSSKLPFPAFALAVLQAVGNRNETGFQLRVAYGKGSAIVAG